jgi:SAM-dependent methyltransferase
VTLPLAIRATLAEAAAERHPEADEDVHFLRSVVRPFVEELTQPGDVVLDPFAGFGTTLEVAAELGRVAVGVELLPERVEIIRARVPGAVVVEGDARGLAALGAAGELPVGPGTVALVLSSPPYMTAVAHPENPLTAYETDDGDYRRYLGELAEIARQLGTMLRPDGHVVLNVADIDHAGHLTPLVADVTAAVGDVLEHVTTIAVVWDELPHDLVADRLVVFRRPG